MTPKDADAMIVYEVCSMDRDGALNDPYYLHCADLGEAHAHVGDRHGEDAVIIRAIEMRKLRNGVSNDAPGASPRNSGH